MPIYVPKTPGPWLPPHHPWVMLHWTLQKFRHAPAWDFRGVIWSDASPNTPLKSLAVSSLAILRVSSFFQGNEMICLMKLLNIIQQLTTSHYVSMNLVNPSHGLLMEQDMQWPWSKNVQKIAMAAMVRTASWDLFQEKRRLRLGDFADRKSGEQKSGWFRVTWVTNNRKPWNPMFRWSRMTHKIHKSSTQVGKHW